MTLTVLQVETETARYLQSWGHAVHDDTAGATRDLVGRALKSFVRQTMCLFSSQITYSATTAYVNLESTLFTKGSDSVEVYSIHSVKLTSTGGMINRTDLAYWENSDTTTTGTIGSWLMASAKELQFVPPPSAPTGLTFSAFYYHPAITSASPDGTNITLPDEAMDVFLKYVTLRRAETFVDGATGQRYEAEAQRCAMKMSELLHRYELQPPWRGTWQTDPQTVQFGVIRRP